MNADKFVVRGQTYDVLSPATFGDYIETVGAACINPSGYAENKLFLAYDDNVQKLFRATAAIAYSELLIKDTNCEPTTMAEALANALSAGGVSYDNTDSGLTASNVQDAIDEVNGDVETVNSDLTKNEDAQTMLGAKNICPVTLTDEVDGSVTYTVNPNKSITVTISGTLGSDTNKPISNGWTGFDISAWRGKKLVFTGAQLPFRFNCQIADSSRNLIRYAPVDTEYEIPNNAQYCIPILFSEAGATGTYTFYPMIRPAGTDSTYVPYAKTNRELTESIVFETRTGLTAYANGQATFVGNKDDYVLASAVVLGADGGLNGYAVPYRWAANGAFYLSTHKYDDSALASDVTFSAILTWIKA